MLMMCRFEKMASPWIRDGALDLFVEKRRVSSIKAYCLLGLGLEEFSRVRIGPKLGYI